jgi:glycogen debranching enzyme
VSTMDPPYPHLAPAVNQLTTAVCAPAAALSAHDGQIRASGLDGLFISDVRVLTEARLRFGGVEPHPLAGVPEGTGRVRFVAVARDFGDRAPDPTVRVERLRQVLPDGMTERLRLVSTAAGPVRVAVTVDLRCDLTPLESAKAGLSRPPLAPQFRPAAVAWAQDGMEVEVTAPDAVFGASPDEDVRLAWPIVLEPGSELSLTWTVRLRETDPVLVGPAGPIEWARPAVRCDDVRLPRLLGRALDDLAGLRLRDIGVAPIDDGPVGTFLAAGAPWFLTLFGRDSIWAAWMMLPLGTELAEGTLHTLARRQGLLVDPVSGEAPGKIMHELRHEDPRLGRAVRTSSGAMLPATYYGTVDATLLWISLLADARRWGLPDDRVRPLLSTLDRALSWLDQYGDPDGDGFVEYVDTSGRGLANQGWKDSGDAIRYHDGSLATPPIALCEVQGYAHRAALDAAELLDAFDRPGADGWRAYARALAERFRERFWVSGPLGRFPALAIDGAGRPVDSLTSNIGHLLGTGLLDSEEEATVARLLAAPTLAGGYGLRTMSDVDRGFAPLSYHCGSIWPHDTAIALLGLARVGGDAAAAQLIQGLLAAGEAFGYRLPELFAGDGRADLARPVPHPGACGPQAWAAAAAVAVLQAVLGLRVDVPRGEVRVRPLDVAGLGAIEVRGLRIAGQPVDISLDRAGTVRVSGLPGYLRLVDETPGPAERIAMTATAPRARPTT